MKLGYARPFVHPAIIQLRRHIPYCGAESDIAASFPSLVQGGEVLRARDVT